MLPVTTHSETTRQQQQQQQQQCPARKYAAQGGERVGDSARLVVALLCEQSCWRQPGCRRFINTRLTPYYIQYCNRKILLKASVQ